MYWWFVWTRNFKYIQYFEKTNSDHKPTVLTVQQPGRWQNLQQKYNCRWAEGPKHYKMGRVEGRSLWGSILHFIDIGCRLGEEVIITLQEKHIWHLANRRNININIGNPNLIKICYYKFVHIFCVESFIIQISVS